jgi:hypothetical protein
MRSLSGILISRGYSQYGIVYLGIRIRERIEYSSLGSDTSFGEYCNYVVLEGNIQFFIYKQEFQRVFLALRGSTTRDQSTRISTILIWFES